MLPMRWVSADASRFTIRSWPRGCVIAGLLNFIPTADPTLCLLLRVSIARSVTRVGGARLGPYARIRAAYRKRMSAHPQGVRIRREEAPREGRAPCEPAHPL